MPLKTHRKSRPCQKAGIERVSRSDPPQLPSPSFGFGVKFPESIENQLPDLRRHLPDTGVLRDLPNDALLQVQPHIPTLVVDVDALIGTKDATTYRRKMVEATRNLQRQLVEQAEKDGYGPMAFTASHVHPLRDKDSGRWPMFLASLLVQEPSKAHQTNEELLREVAENMGVRPFAKSYMSKSLTKRQKHVVMDILRKHDYPVNERHLKTGTDIRRLVQARTWQGDESAPVNLRIQVASRPGSISIGGTLYKLHSRRGKPKGDPLLDLELNVDKARIPLGAAMKMLGLKDARVAALLRHLPSM